MSKEDSKIIQGLSVLAMVCLHLFDNLNYADLFTPLIMLKGYPLIFYFAQLSDFCVMGFVFCSGYAHMKLFHQENYYKKRLISLLSLYCNFWIILFLFTFISVATGQADFGTHSTNIWFTHMFFYFVLFPRLVYRAEYPIPIFLFMLAICVAVSYVINLIYYPVNKQVRKLEKLL